MERELTDYVTTLADRLVAQLQRAARRTGWPPWRGRCPPSVPAPVWAPAEDHDRLVALLHQDTVAIDVLLSPDLVAPDDLAEAAQAFLQLRRELDALARQRQGRGGGDLLSFLTEQHDAGRISWDDVLTRRWRRSPLAPARRARCSPGMVEAFARFPDQWEQLRADRSLIKPAIEEALRWVSPALSMGRVAYVDFALHGRQIRAGDVLQCGMLPANRDPAVFPDPHAFDITRGSRPRPDGQRGAPGQAGAAHVAFGGGTHTCLGAHVARLEARVVLERLLDRYAGFELADGAGRPAPDAPDPHVRGDAGAVRRGLRGASAEADEPTEPADDPLARLVHRCITDGRGERVLERAGIVDAIEHAGEIDGRSRPPQHRAGGEELVDHVVRDLAGRRLGDPREPEAADEIVGQRAHRRQGIGALEPRHALQQAGAQRS